MPYKILNINHRKLTTLLHQMLGLCEFKRLKNKYPLVLAMAFRVVAEDAIAYGYRPSLSSFIYGSDLHHDN